MRGARVTGTDGLAVASGGRPKVAALAAVLVGCLMLILSSSASALIHRGHEFTGTLGAGELSRPNDVAVDEATGDIYVLDAGHSRILHYNSKHELLQVWGAGAKTAGSKEYEVCNAPEACQSSGVAGFGKYQLDDPVALAVDNDTSTTDPSRGDVYVIANETAKKAVLDKFSAEGAPIARLFSSKEEREHFEENRPVGVAIDPHTGMVWVDREAEEEELLIQRLGNGEQNKEVGVPTTIDLETLHGPARPGLAIDGKGDLYMTYEPGGHTLEEQEEEEEDIKEENQERKKSGEPLLTPQLPCEKHHCLAVKLSVQTAGESLEASVAENPVDGQNTSGLALDTSTGDVYLDHVTSVSALTSRAQLSQSFGSEQLGTPPSAGDGVAIYSATNEVFVPDAGKGVIDVYGPAKAGVPEINPTSPRAAKATDVTAELLAGIDPRGAKVHYRFEYGTEPCSAAPCKQEGTSELAPGFGEAAATQEITGLSPATKYYAQVTVEYSFEEEGQTKTGTIVSQEHSFTTSPATNASELPDHRVWELVSPPQKDGAAVEPALAGGGLIQSSADGNALTYLATGPMCSNEPEGNRGPEPSQIFAVRGSAGWSCANITPPNTEGVGPLANEKRAYQFFSSDLSQSLVDPIDRVPLSKKAGRSVYIRHDFTCSAEPENCFEPLVTEANGGEFQAGKTHLALMGGTPDLKHVIVRAHLNKLQSQAPADGLYEWTAGELTLVSILPGGQPTTEETFLGAGDDQQGAQYNHMTLTAISHDGNRVVWYQSNQGHHQEGKTDPHLYQRNVEQEETLQVDELEEGAPAPKDEGLGALFQTANADGSKVFFTDAAPLTKSSKARENPREPDLYVFEPEQKAGHRVTDLTLPLNKGEPAAVRGAVVGTSEDGSVVYFVANGVLAPGAERGDCGEPLGSCNLYVERDGEGGWEAPQFIAKLSNRDGPDWALPEGDAIEDYRLEYKTSEVSPDGQYVAFMSEDSLTGYDNTDVTGAARDEEVFLYNDAAEGAAKVTCVSCDPSGAPPTGLHDVLGGSQILADVPETWTSTYTETAEWLAGSLPGWTAYAHEEANYQPHYLNDKGQLFFNSSESLVPSDSNRGGEDVYEFEPVGAGTCSSADTNNGCVSLISNGKSEQESVFLDASENGEDVFFMTAAKLVPQDTDTAEDVYDARACGVEGAEACPTPSPPPPTKCGGEGCRPLPEGELSFGTAGTSTVGASGNVLGTTESKPPGTSPPPPTNVQKLAKALKTCRTKYKGKKNKAKLQKCEKTARKHYPVRKAAKFKRGARG